MTTSADPRRNDLRSGENLDRLATWLRAHLLPDWTDLRFSGLIRTSGGVSYETWLLDVEDPELPDERQRRVVLRREPLRGPVEPYNVLDEAEVYRGLADSGVPVPRVLATCADRSVTGRPFIVTEFVAGDVPDYRTITGFPEWQDEAGRARMARQFLSLLVETQRTDWRCIAPLAATVHPHEDERTRLHRLIDDMLTSAEYRTEAWVPHPIFREAARWCQEHAPDGDLDGMVIVHGDFKVGNFIWREGRIRAFLDWEGARVGDPLQDLGYACHPAMREPRPDLMAMLAPIDDFVGLYEELSGRTVNRQRLHYYVIYALVFHTWTLLVGLPSIAEWDGDMRMATGYKKLPQVTRMLTDQIEAYEDGRGVL